MAIVQALEECYGYTGKEGRPKKTTANAVVPPDEICTPEKTSPSGLVLCENEPASITQEEFASKVNLHEMFSDNGQSAYVEEAAKRIIRAYDSKTYISPSSGLNPYIWGYEKQLDLYIDEDGIEAFRPILSEYIDAETLDSLQAYLHDLNFDAKYQVAYTYLSALEAAFSKYRLSDFRNRRKLRKALASMNKQQRKTQQLRHKLEQLHQ